jgi:glucokinase
MPAQRTVVGVDVGGTSTRGAVVGADGELLLRVEHSTDVSGATKGIIEVVDEVLGRADEAGVEPESIGVGAAGFIDAATGSVTFSPNVTYGDPNIADALRSRFRLPVVVDNDANAAAWGERAFGAARGCDHVALLTLGTGVGSGFIVDGEMVRGSTGAGAEFGHVVVDPQGPPCRCGLEGCIEQFASGTAIARMGREAALQAPASSMVAHAGAVEDITGEHVARAAHDGDEAAVRVLETAGTWLGIGLSNVVNLFDPELIVLGGSAVAAGEPYLGAARAQLARMNHAQRRRGTRVELTALGDDAGLAGAAALALDRATR